MQAQIERERERYFILLGGEVVLASQFKAVVTMQNLWDMKCCHLLNKHWQLNLRQVLDLGLQLREAVLFVSDVLSGGREYEEVSHC